MKSFSSWPRKVVLASGNAGKLREISSWLAPLGTEVLLQSTYEVPTVAETGVSFLENALIKARHCARHTGLASLADDSGLCVSFLQREPGVRSARYAGPEATDVQNVAKLLQALEKATPSHRAAYFWCSLVWVREAGDPTPLVAEGQLRGHITEVIQGSDGFGYDPVFCPVGFDKTLAQMSLSQKNQVSHRGMALRKLCAQMCALSEDM